jgi:hypothetical protein
MVITYSGNNYFKLQSGETVLLIDPENQRSFKGAHVVLNTLFPTEVDRPKDEAGAPFWIERPGEYEVKEIMIRGWSTGHEKDTNHIAYKIVIDEISVGVLGHLKDELSEQLREEFGGLDILIVPASGKPLISEILIAKLVRELEPSMIIPALTKDPKQFLKAMGTHGETEEKLVVKKKDFSPGTLTVRCLTF